MQNRAQLLSRVGAMCAGAASTAREYLSQSKRWRLFHSTRTTRRLQLQLQGRRRVLTWIDLSHLFVGLAVLFLYASMRADGHEITQSGFETDDNADKRGTVTHHLASTPKQPHYD